jgi:alkylated DNA repair dioxygenase AlkB
MKPIAYATGEYAAPIAYVPTFVPNPDDAFTRLRDELEWERRGDAPRCEYYCNDTPKPYVYGRDKGRRLYEPRPYHPVILAIRTALENLAGAVFDVCFLNRYLNQSDHLGWHADDSPEMDDARPVASVSLGVEREIWFRTKPVPGLRGGEQDHVVYDQAQTPSGDLVLVASIQKLVLGHGSLCLMAPGMQDAWQHRIPKASRQCGERISLTFRGYVDL